MRSGVRVEWGGRRGDPRAEGKGMVGRGDGGAFGEGGAVGECGGVERRVVGDGRDMVHSSRRWPDLPHPRQHRGSLQSATEWCLRGARQRKQLPFTERRGGVFAGEAGAGGVEDSRISRYDLFSPAAEAVNAAGLAGSSRSAPSPYTGTTGRHGGEASSPMPCADERTIDVTGRRSRPGS
jgi:hypothetical protein